MIERLWYAGWPIPHVLLWPLLPLGWLYRVLALRRRRLYLSGQRDRYRAPVPVIVVGNITVGGTGKTPLVIWLVDFLQQMGRNPGVISRGYGGNATDWPRLVSSASSPDEIGDEPLLISRRTRVPVVCDPDRPRGVRKLLEYKVDIVIADDGLQHYPLERDLEIVVIDSRRLFGNRRCLPAGPLREPVSRAAEADLLVFNGMRQSLPGCESVPAGEMLMEGGVLRNLASGREESLSKWRGRRVNAVAGIGNPDRFFSFLKRMGIEPVPHPFPDHYRFKASDLRFRGDLPIIMTEKDAVKCMSFDNPSHWYLPVVARFEPASANLLDSKIRNMLRGSKTA